MTAPLDYDALVAVFEHSLLTQLRGHSAAAPFLECWVPDEDPVRGLQNVFEAAEIAGERSLALRVSMATLPAERLPELRAIAEEFGTLTVTATGDAWRLELDGVGLSQILHGVAPAFRSALRTRLGRFEHDGRFDVADASIRLVTVAQDGFTLSAQVDPATQVIREARHDGPDEPLARTMLDQLCALLPGLTIQEASDHAGHRLIARLAAAEAPRPVAGILLPDNADPLFRRPKALVRALLAEWRRISGYDGRYNDFTTAPASAWSSLPGPERQRQVADLLEVGSAADGVAAGALRLVAMEPNILGHEVRAIIAFAEAIGPDDKPGLARRAERLLQRRLDPHIELYVEELKDQNAIRRL
jgi:hypothetical protein